MSQLQKPTTRQYYWQGFRTGLPFLIVVGPFGMLFGVVATETWLDLLQSMAMSFLVIAGAAQFAAVQLLAENAPVLVIILTGLAVNLRMMMYSAALVPHLGAAPQWQRVLAAYFLVDQTYTASVLKFENTPTMSLKDKVAFFFGTVTPICPLWYVFTYIGVVAGSTIPPQYALDFAVPITFIAIVAPNLRSLPHLAAAVVSVVVSLMLAWMPLNLWLMIAALLAMITGAFVEQRIKQYQSGSAARTLS